MNDQLRCYDVLRIAEGVERRESLWYAHTAEIADNPALKATCHDLLTWHRQHQQLWADLGRALFRKTNRFRSSGNLDSLLPESEAMAGLTWFGGRPSAFSRYQNWNTREEILQIARKRSRDLMIFYRGLKDFTTDPASFDMLDRILEQECAYTHFIEQRMQCEASLPETGNRLMAMVN